MGSFTKSTSGVRTLYVWAPNNPALALEILDRHIRSNMINPREYDRAVLCDNGPSNNNSEDPKNYTLKFYSKDRTEALWISGLSVGPRCSGSHGTLQSLMLMGFDPNPERDVFQLAKGTKKVFTKKNKYI